MIDPYGNEISWLPNLSNKNEPLYISIADCIEEDIKKGMLEGGFRLPPQRIIANYLGINHTTVTRAYKLCEEKGLIKGITGKGTYVTSYAGIPQNLLSNSHSNIIDMGMVLPLHESNGLLESFLREIYYNMDYNDILSYVPPEGHIKHRYIASQWLKQYDLDYSVDQIIITSGAQNALAVVLTSLFKRGDRILVDEYTYTGLITLSKLLGIILIPVKTLDDGIDIGELTAACDRENAKGIYLIPDCHNPTTAVLSYEKRQAIGEIIQKYNLLLIEDNPFIYTAQEGGHKPICMYAKDHGIFIASTSKSINPTFRVSYLATPKKYTDDLIHGVNNLTWMASPLNAEILSQILSTSKYSQIVTNNLSVLRQRNRIVDQILGGFNLKSHTTALFRYLILPPTISDKDIEHSCLIQGVQVFSAKRFAASTHRASDAIRISVSGPKRIDELETGLSILADILKQNSMNELIV